MFFFDFITVEAAKLVGFQIAFSGVRRRDSRFGFLSVSCLKIFFKQHT